MSALDTYAALLREDMESRFQPVEGGPMDGLRVLTAKDVGEAFSTVPYPPAEEHSAELAEPAEVSIVATCHVVTCGRPIRISGTLASYTRAQSEKRIAGLFLVSTPVIHVCGQGTLFDADAVPGQADFELGDVVGPEDALSAEETGDVPPDPNPAEDGPPAPPEAPKRRRRAGGTRRSSRKAEAVPEGACPFPGCALPAEHPGEHNAADGDILPGES